MKENSKVPQNLCAWMQSDNMDDDIIISSRIRLARNLNAYTFPNHAEDKELEDARNKINEVLENQERDLIGLNMEDLSSLDKEALIERHLISREQSKNSYPCSTFINDNQTVSIMINEEDHIRMQFIKSGEELFAAWEEADEFDNKLESELDFAFSPELGYLTACPTNLGTGMRASVMLHLPGLSMTDKIDKLLGGVGKFGLTVRGIFGEGTEGEGSIFQLSNQVTLGIGEEDIIENLHSILQQIVEQEKEERKNLLKNNEYEIKDKIMRALGVLKHAYKINNLEAVHFISLLMLGDYYEMFSNFSRKKLMELIVLTRPAHLQINFAEKMDTTRRDILRARMIRDKLSSFKL